MGCANMLLALILFSFRVLILYVFLEISCTNWNTEASSSGILTDELGFYYATSSNSENGLKEPSV